ncbi:MAG TPA: hypothetical protein VFP34_12435 [Microlunatus sp.]|nr:hypothetical protein [Microlunatus sp.]
MTVSAIADATLVRSASPGTGPQPDGHGSGVSVRSPEWVIANVMDLVREPSWCPASAARMVCQQIDDEAELRRARLWLRMTVAERMTLSQARALATLNVAINSAEDASATTAVDGLTLAGEAW